MKEVAYNGHLDDAQTRLGDVVWHLKQAVESLKNEDGSIDDEYKKAVAQTGRLWSQCESARRRLDKLPAYEVES